MPKWLVHIILFSSQCAVIGVVFSSFFFAAFAKQILPPATGPEPHMGIGVVFIVFIPAVMLVMAISLCAYFLLKSLVSTEKNILLIAASCFITAWLIHMYIAPTIKDREHQQRSYETLKRDFNQITSDSHESSSYASDRFKDFDFSGGKDDWLLRHIENDSKIRSLLLSVFADGEPFRISRNTFHDIFPNKFFWNETVTEEGKRSFTATYRLNDPIRLGKREYHLAVVEKLKSEQHPFLKIAHAELFGKDRLGVHFQIVNTPYRFIIFVTGERRQIYDQSRYAKSLFTESIIWEDDSGE